MARESRLRRIIYNDDGGEVKHMESADVEAMLEKRIRRLEATHVDTVCYCGHDNFYQSFYRTDLPDVELVGGEGLRQAIEAGDDPSRAVLRECRALGLEVIWSFRMNDIHESYGAQLSSFKREHRAWLLGDEAAAYPAVSVRRGIWSALDFEVPEVRSHIVSSVEDVCAQYEPDGIELDYGRNASFFRTTFDGQAATASQTDLLTELQIELRAVAAAASRSLRRPMPVAAVVPDTVDLCRYVGIDIERWLAGGIVDILIPGNGYVPFSMPVRELIDTAHRYDVPAYPRLNLNADERVFWRHIEAWYAAAANNWHAGADGIYYINTYDTTRSGNELRDAAFTTCGDPDALREKPKLHCADIDFATISYGGGDVRYYTPSDHLVPVALDGTDYVSLYLADDVGVGGHLVSATLRLRIDEDPADRGVSVTLNGTELRLRATDADARGGENRGAAENPGDVGQPVGRWYTAADPEKLLRSGENRIGSVADVVFSSPRHAPILERVELWLSPGPPTRQSSK